MLMNTSVVGRMRRVVHLNAYSSPKSLSSEALDVSEICVDTRQHFEPLKDYKQVNRNTTYNPKLFISPPFINTHS
jgi:hypothetical protein